MTHHVHKLKLYLSRVGSRKRATLATLLILFLVLPLTVYLTQQRQDIRQKAAAPVRGIAGDFWADIIIGQPDFSEIIPGATKNNSMYIAHGIIVDRTATPNRMYVYDGGNSRVLGYDLGKCLASPSDPLNCSADIVLGQPNFTTSACNGDSGFQNYPNRASASAATLCGLQESQLSISEGGSGSSMAVDSQGNLYVTDFWNHRVLKYNKPFETDKVADDVWGQNDFSGQTCNKGQSTPDATTLCFTWGNSNNWTAGVDVDLLGNVWVVDNGNNRVLRFPAGSKTADLVLGQPDFTSRVSGTTLNQFKDPSAVRVNSSGRVYVADKDNHRVLIFEPPLTSGVSGRVFGSGFNAPAGVDFDPTEQGKVWVDDVGNALLKLVDEGTGQVVKTVGSALDFNLLGSATGSVGIDSSGNIFIVPLSGNYAGDILMFKKGAPTNTPTKTFYRGLKNYVTNRDLLGGNGVVVADNQLIVSDNRLMFWNNPTSLTSGQPADGVAGVNSFTDGIPGCCWIMKADKNHHLYVSLQYVYDFPHRIDIYQLPLTMGARPIKTIGTVPIPQGPTYLPLLGGGQTELGGIHFGLAPSDDGKFLWVSDSDGHRVLRIRNPLENPVVDVILGQLDANRGQCNRGGAATANTLCYPGSLSFDRFGNLYVSDHSLEIRGNYRLLVFNKELFPTNNTSVIFAPGASKVFPRIATWEPAFDSQNHMIAGYNPYWPYNPDGGTVHSDRGHFPGVYLNPLGTATVPEYQLQDYYSMAFSATFDNQDNLYVGDLNRTRVLIYKNPFNNPTPTPSFLPEDINRDGCVSILDFNAWLRAMQTGTPFAGTYPDVNRDGRVDIVDFNLWLIAMRNGVNLCP